VGREIASEVPMLLGRHGTDRAYTELAAQASGPILVCYNT
jgi:hypothetical protein